MPPGADGHVVDVRRSEQRFLTRAEALESRSSFSFGAHYDPDNVGFGPLIVSNEDVLQPGGGFDPHPHAGMEIVTWVLAGALRYEDDAGRRGVAVPGRLQRMSSGRGITHAEYADGDEPVHYVQMWVVSDEPDAEPGYDLVDVEAELDAGGLVALASGRPGVQAVLPLRNRGATLHAARLAVGDEVELPAAPLLHLFLGRGEAELAGAGSQRGDDAVRLHEGDAVRMRAAGPRWLRAVQETELLAWELPTI